MQLKPIYVTMSIRPKRIGTNLNSDSESGLVQIFEPHPFSAGNVLTYKDGQRTERITKILMAVDP